LRPGAGLGAFNLGMPVCEALAYVEQHRAVFDVVHVKYNDEEPLKVDLVISFPEHGFHLRFEPRSQVHHHLFPFGGDAAVLQTFTN
jgi:hypothetical protein